MSTKLGEFKSVFGIGGPPPPLSTVGRNGTNALPPSILHFKRDGDGNISAKVEPEKNGYLRLPYNLPSLKVPKRGEVTTHELEPGHLLVVSEAGNGAYHVTSKRVSPKVEEKEGTFNGTVLPRQEGGQKVVDVGRHTLPAPAKGTADAYLLSPTKLLSLLAEPDGTVSVLTRLLGLFPTEKGFQGVLFPLAGKVNVAGHELDVSDLTYNRLGLPRTKNLKIEGKEFRVDLLMNQDGTVSVAAAPPKGSLFSRLVGGIGKALNFLGNFTPLLAAVPGLGVAAKVLSIAGAVTGFFDSAKHGNVLGMLGSAAGAVAGFAQGAFQSIASKVAQAANLGQQVVQSLTHGLGQGLLQVVSNGASLVSGFAKAVANLGQGSTQESASNIAQTAGDVARYTSAADGALKGQPGRLLANVAEDVLPSLVKPKSEEPKPFDSGSTPVSPKDSATRSSSPDAAPSYVKGGPHNYMQEILGTFPERPDVKVPRTPVLVANKPTVSDSAPEDSGGDLRKHDSDIDNARVEVYIDGVLVSDAGSGGSSPNGAPSTTKPASGQPVAGERPKSGGIGQAWADTVRQSREDAEVLSQSSNPLEWGVGNASKHILDGATGVNDAIRTARDFYAQGANSPLSKVGAGLTALGASAASIVTFGDPTQSGKEATGNLLEAGVTLGTMGLGPAAGALSKTPAGQAIAAWGDDTVRAVLNSPVGQTFTGSAQGAVAYFTRLNQLPNEVLKNVPLPGGGNLAQGVDDALGTIRGVNNLGKAPAANTAAAAAPTPEAGGGERPAFEGFRYPGAAEPDEFRVINNKATPGERSEWDIRHPQWVGTVVRDIRNQHLKQGDILPMPAGVRPSAGDLAALTKAAERELALTFIPAPSGSGPGRYFVHIGDKYSVPLNLRDGELLIAHTHPQGTHLPIDAWPSSGDVDLPFDYSSHIFGPDRSHTLFTTRQGQFKKDLDKLLED